MANLVTDIDLEAAAFDLAHWMLAMVDRAGGAPDPIGPDIVDVDALRREDRAGEQLAR